MKAVRPLSAAVQADAVQPSAPALAPLCPRTAAMDALVKKLNTSPKYAFEAVAAAVNTAMTQQRNTQV